MPLTLREWYCMKDGRSSFRPRLTDDAHLIFCHTELIQEDIISSIQMRFSTNDPVKMLIYGDWGVGKTHLTYHIKWWLDKNQSEYPAFPVIIEIGDINKKSHFDEIVRPFLDGLGLDFIIELVHEYRGKVANVSQSLRKKGIVSHIADAFNKFLLSAPGQAPVDLVTQTFEYLKGRKVSAASSGLGQQLEQSQDFIDVLTALGEMYQAVKGHRMIFIADEAARLESVEGDEASRTHWINANKLIFDDKNRVFGFIYTASGKGSRELPPAIWDPQIQNRLGQNIFRLESLSTTDVETYLEKLVNEFVDRDKVSKLVAEGVIPPADYNVATYPFVLDARDAFLDYFNRTQEDSKPRDISSRLDELAFLAGKLGSRLITRECLTQKNM